MDIDLRVVYSNGGSLDDEMNPKVKEVATVFLFVLVASSIGYYLIVPSSANQGLQPDGRYTVRQGDSLFTIGESLQVPWLDIAQANGIKSPYLISRGESLVIPVDDPFCASAYGTVPIDDSTNTTYGAPTYQQEGNVSADKRVIIRFDDGYQDVWTNALPVLAQYGYHAVFAVIDSYQKTYAECTPYQSYTESPYLNWPEVQWLNSNGNEISDHTLNHYDMDDLSASGLYTQVVESKTLFEAHGIDPTSLTLPLGDGFGNSTVMNYIMANGFKEIYTVEGVEGAQTAFYPYSQVFVQWNDIDIGDNQSLAHFESVVNQTDATTVIGLTFHSVGSDTSPTYEVSSSNFAADMAYLHQNGFDVIIPSQLPGWDSIISPSNQPR